MTIDEMLKMLSPVPQPRVYVVTPEVWRDLAPEFKTPPPRVMVDGVEAFELEDGTRIVVSAHAPPKLVRLEWSPVLKRMVIDD